MSWVLFIDESGQDHRASPYEVLAGIAVEDSTLWPLIQRLSDAQLRIFGTRLFEAYGDEAKAQKLLKRKVFRHAAQMPAIPPGERCALARAILEDGTSPTRAQLTALGQAKIAYCDLALRLCENAGVQAFASIVPRQAVRPQSDMLRRDYVYFFERFYYFLNSRVDDPMGYLVFDELDKSASHILLGQVKQYFQRTRNGRIRARRIIPEPFFVHSDLTSMVQIADLVAYIISWGVRLRGMNEPARSELDTLAHHVLRLRFRQQLASGTVNYGFKLINRLV